jgi:hypothetical protein
MSQPADIVVERATVREVSGVIDAGAPVEAAIEVLLLAGLDRADIDVLANDDEVRQRLGSVEVPAEELPDIPEVPRHAPIKSDDVASVSTLAIALPGAIGGIAGAIVAAAYDLGWGESAVTVLACAVVAAGAAAVAARWFVRRRAVLDPDADAAVLWVRVRSPAAEERARRVLLTHGVRAVRVHEIELDKCLHDIPLGALLARETAP